MPYRLRGELSHGIVMQHLWSPWRFDYVSTAAKQQGCIFCTALENPAHPDSLIVHRAKLNFVLLNRFPYNNGHIMIAPVQHVPSPDQVDIDVLQEMMLLSQKVMRALREVYQPDGFNLGMNVGRYAGAGIEEHYHLHVVPRWSGDTNFMAAVAETRVIPEDFATTLSKLKPFFE